MLLAVALVQLAVRVVTLPFAVLLRRRLLEYGLTEQSWAGFASDQVRGQAVGIVTLALGLVVLVGCARRWPRAWPAVAAGLLAVFVLLASFVYPVVVEPLFNSFEPLPDGSLRTQILRLADREGVRVDDVLVADASRRTTTLNAYVSGFGGTRRVVVYDNLVESLPEDEALSVVAHELAHARHNDVVTGSLLGAAGAVLGVGLLALLLGAGRPGPTVDGGPGRGAARPGPARASARCSRARCRTPSAGRSRPGRTSTRCAPPGTRRPSPPCSASWRCGRWPTRPRRRGPSSGSAATRPR